MKQLELRGIMWILGVVALLMASETWSSNPGTNHNNNSNSTPPKSTPLNVYRNETSKLGSTVKLTCANKTWSEMLYTIWTINLRKKQCIISHSDDGRSNNSCKDGKTLHNISTGEYLFIPNISNSDEGVYKCESAYKGGSDFIFYTLSVTVPPEMSATVKMQGGKRVAVCLAERGKPAASIVWSYMAKDTNATFVDTQLQDGLYTVKSQLDLPEGAATDNLNCAIHHPFWDTEQIFKPEDFSASASDGSVPWGVLLISLLAVSIIGTLLGLLYFTHRHLIVIRRCWKSNTTTPSEAKSPPIEEVEEVEPYASYVQRVNSIYNSSADLFT